MHAETVTDYVNNLEEDRKSDINAFVAFMNNEFPEIVPKISFSMPMWWTGRKMYDGYVAISSASKHYSVHFYDESYISKLKELLQACSFGKRCINIKYGDEASASVVKKLVKDYIESIV